jgi:serine/threonine protein phosphatase PrpC
MGVYLTKACTEIETDEGEGGGLKYCVSDMQGWRKNMEDAHIAVPDLSKLTTGMIEFDQNASIFGVFDGHGGKEVAKFVADKFIQEIIELESFKLRDYANSLRQAFHRMDELLEDDAYEPLLKQYKKIPNPSDSQVAKEEQPITNNNKDMKDNEDDDDDETMSSKEAMDLFDRFMLSRRGGKSTDKKEIKNGYDDNDKKKENDTIKQKPKIKKENNQLVSGPPLVPIAPVASTIIASKPIRSNVVIEPNTDEVCRLADHRVNAGCTSVVAFKNGNKLYVANAGDSRGVLCRKDGVCLPLSEDHKPQSEIEFNRIVSAGGFVNEVGRINGNLNLSRALGDLKYKQVPGLTPPEQIITAEPDISITELLPTDEFFILGCDGIWDCLSSQEAVDFVKDRLDDGMELKKIIDEVLEYCLADNPQTSQGIGADNMTFLCVLLNK